MVQLEKYYPNEWLYPFVDYDVIPTVNHKDHESKTFECEIEGLGKFSFLLSDSLQTFELSHRADLSIVLSKRALTPVTLRQLMSYEKRTGSILDGVHCYWDTSTLGSTERSSFGVQLKIPQGITFTNKFIGESLGEANTPEDGWAIDQTSENGYLFVNRNEPDYIKDICARIKFPL